PYLFENPGSACNLAATHECGEQLRPQADRAEAQDRAPGVTDQHQLARVELLEHVFGDVDDVARHLVEGHVRRIHAVPAERPARAALIALGHDEPLLPRRKYREER